VTRALHGVASQPQLLCTWRRSKQDFILQDHDMHTKHHTNQALTTSPIASVKCSRLIPSRTLAFFYTEKTHTLPSDRQGKEKKKKKRKGPVGQEAAINLVNQGIVSGCKENPKQSQPPIIQPSRPTPASCILLFLADPLKNIGLSASIILGICIRSVAHSQC